MPRLGWCHSEPPAKDLLLCLSRRLEICDIYPNQILRRMSPQNDLLGDRDTKLGKLVGYSQVFFKLDSKIAALNGSFRSKYGARRERLRLTKCSFVDCHRAVFAQAHDIHRAGVFGRAGVVGSDPSIADRGGLIPVA